MSNQNNKKTPAQKKSVRLIAIILAALMVGSVATIGIGLLVTALSGEPETHQAGDGHNH
jgi:flagellar basal body-associated protein FliL